MTENSQPSSSPDQSPGILACLGGALIAGGLAFALYLLTNAIAVAFASKPLHTDNITAQNISTAVRTLVVGVSTLGTAIFGITALGLVGLASQTLVQRIMRSSP